MRLDHTNGCSFDPTLRSNSCLYSYNLLHQVCIGLINDSDNLIEVRCSFGLNVPDYEHFIRTDS